MAGGGAGGGGGEAGGGGDGAGDGRAWHYCTSCNKWLWCHQWWLEDFHQASCEAEQAKIHDKLEQNLAKDKAQRLENQRRKDKKAAKDTTKTNKGKANASSKGKAENPKRNR